MKRSVRLWMGMAAAVVSLFPWHGAQANFPSQPIRMIAGYPPGGNVDIIARAVAEEMSRIMNQPVVVENRPGASGQIAATSVARARPDGYTLFLGASPELAISTSLGRPLEYDATKDFQPLSLVSQIYFGVVINPGLKADTFPAFLDLARKSPGKLNFASFGQGSSNHLFGELLNSETGVQIQHVPYKGSGAALTELGAGQVQMMMENVGVVLPQVQAGRLKLVAVTSEERSPLAPDVPTMKELGYPGLTGGTWTGFVLPKGVPADIVDTYSRVIEQVAKSERVKKQLADKGITLTTSTPKAFGDFIAKEIELWRGVGKKANVSLN